MFKPTTVGLRSSPEAEGSLRFKRVGLERAVFSLFDRRRTRHSWQATMLRERRWPTNGEGFPEAPRGEAAYADTFLAEHPTSPIVPFVHLFAGHRKLCAGNLMKDLKSDNAAAQRTVREAEAQLIVARDSSHPLIRVVTEHLLQTRRCLER